MANSNPRDRERDPATPKDAKVERAALAFLIDKHPDDSRSRRYRG
jgi:hypothetical protein